MLHVFGGDSREAAQEFLCGSIHPRAHVGVIIGPDGYGLRWIGFWIVLLKVVEYFRRCVWGRRPDDADTRKCEG